MNSRTRFPRSFSFLFRAGLSAEAGPLEREDSDIKSGHGVGNNGGTGLDENRNSMTACHSVSLPYLVGLASGIILGIAASVWPALTTPLVIMSLPLLMIWRTGIPEGGIRLYLSVWMIVLALYVWQSGTVPDLRVMLLLTLTSVAFIIGNLLVACDNRLTPRRVVELNSGAGAWYRILLLLEFVGIVLVSYQALLATKALGVRLLALILAVNWRESVPSLEQVVTWSRGLVSYGLFFAYFGFLLSISLRRFGVRIPAWHTLLDGLLVVVSISVAGNSLRRNYVYEMLASAFFIWTFALPRRQRRYILATALVAASILLFSFVQTQRVLNKSTGSGWRDVLVYITLNLENAKDALDREVVFGQRSFYLLSLALDRVTGGRLRAPYYWNPVNERLGGYNTLPYFAEWAADVGIPGSILMSLMWGIATAVVARYALRSPLWLVIHGLLSTSIALSFRSNFVSHFSFWFLVAMAAGVAFVVNGVTVQGRLRRTRAKIRVGRERFPAIRDASGY